MTTVRITVPKHHIKALQYSMAIKDIRYYMNGINVQSNGVETRLASTDGHRLAVAISRFGTEPHPSVNFTIPTDMVKNIVKQKNAKGVAFECIIIEYDTETKSITVVMANTTVTCTAVEGVYPDYYRVLRKPFSAPSGCIPAMFNPQYVLDAELSYCDFNQTTIEKSFVRFCPKGEDAAGIISCADFVHIVMPVHTSKHSWSDTVINGLNQPLVGSE